MWWDIYLLFCQKLPLSLPVKEFWKSVSIWQCWRQKQNATFFPHMVYFIFPSDMGFSKVSNGWRDFQGHSGHRYWHHAICQSSIITYTIFRPLSVIYENKKVTWPWTLPFRGNNWAKTRHGHLHTKFELHSLIYSKDRKDNPKLKIRGDLIHSSTISEIWQITGQKLPISLASQKFTS